MYKFLLMLPRGLQRFLLSQPLPDHWIEALREKQEESAAANERRLDLNAGWKQSYNLILAMVVLLVSALVMYLILR